MKLVSSTGTCARSDTCLCGAALASLHKFVQQRTKWSVVLLYGSQYVYYGRADVEAVSGDRMLVVHPNYVAEV